MLADQAEGPEKNRLRERIHAGRAEAADRAEQPGGPVSSSSPAPTITKAYLPWPRTPPPSPYWSWFPLSCGGAPSCTSTARSGGSAGSAQPPNGT